MAKKAEAPAQGAKQKQPKYFEDQFDDEVVLFVFRKHPIVMRKGLVLGMLGPLIGIMPAFIETYIAPDQVTLTLFFVGLALGCLLGVLVFMPSWISWHFSVFILTDQRFIQITQKGMFHRAVADLALAQIQSVNYEVAGLQETLLGFGTIRMQTYVGDLTIKDVHKPAHIQKKLLRILRDEGITVNSSGSGKFPSGATKPAIIDETTEEEDEEETE